MCLYIFEYVHGFLREFECIHLYVCMCAHVLVFAHTHARVMFVRIKVGMKQCVYMRVYLCGCACVCVRVCVRT